MIGDSVIDVVLRDHVVVGGRCLDLAPRQIRTVACSSLNSLFALLFRFKSRRRGSRAGLRH